VVSFVSRLAHGEYVMDFDVEQGVVAKSLKKNLDDLRNGLIEDKHQWLQYI
jgi:hypothetical protein